MFSNNKISVRQFQSLFILYVFGTGVIVLPRVVSQLAKQDGWILIIFGMVIALIASYIINSLAGIFPEYSFLEFSKKLVSTPIGSALSLIFAFKLIFSSAMELRIFGEICNQILLKNTPPQAIYIFLLIICAYVVLRGQEVIGRLSEILVYIVLLPVLFVFIFAIIGTDFSNLAPVAKTPPLTLMRGSFFTAFAFRGIEFALFVYPVVNNPKGMKKGMSHAIIFIGLVMLFISVITLSRFGYQDTSIQIWPVLRIMDSIDLPGAFIERQDALIMSIWIISIFVSLSIGIFISSHILDKLFITDYSGYYVIPVAVLIFIIALIPNNIVETYGWLNNCEYILSGIFTFVIPILFLLIAKVKIKKEKKLNAINHD